MEDVTITVWKKHHTSRRWRKDSMQTGKTMQECLDKIGYLYRSYQSTDLKCEVSWSS